MSKFEIVQRNISLVLDSGDEGVQLIGPDPNNKSQFNVQFDEPITIPVHAINPTIEVDEAIIYNNEPNFVSISEFKYDGLPYYVPIGNWGLNELSEFMTFLIRDLPANSTDKIQITGVDAISQVQVLSTKNIEFVSTNFFDVLGFSATQNPILGGKTTLGDNKAKVNAIDYYLIACDIVSNGIRYNNDYNQIVAQVAITQETGSAIIYAPIQPALIPMDEAKGMIRSRVQARLLNNRLEPANTNGESWSVRLRIKWSEIHRFDVSNLDPDMPI
jgi:hypothetical protein